MGSDEARSMIAGAMATRAATVPIATPVPTSTRLSAVTSVRK